MAGKSFKGNLEVLNLSDIFQSLAMNRHSGTLIVHDGKREKKIFFAEGEITLLSTSRRQRLGDLLIASGKIVEEDLDLALKLQKQSRNKKLGEILVEEGFCEEDDISRILRMQIEDELYDLFLWRKAEFEFLADQMPDDMAAESPNLTRLNINTNSLIMEALRRLDEWTLIQNLVPSTKEVFMISDRSAFQDAEVPDRLKTEPELIDGKTNVEGLAERFYVSEFELCQHLAELVKRGAIHALSQEELAERAEAAYALNDFSGSAALYGRLAEYFPNEPKIMVPLADSMRRSGADKQALALYEELAARLEGDGKDPDRLRQCYEAITQLDPTRLDLARKLENLELEAASSQGAKSVVIPLIAVLILVAAGGAAFVFREKILGAKKDPNAGKNAAEVLEKAIRAEKAGDYPAMHTFMQELVQDYKGTNEYDKAELPILVKTVPPGFDVYVNGVYQGLTEVKAPTLVCKHAPANLVNVEIYRPEEKGEGKPPLQTREFPADSFRKAEFVLYSRPYGSFIGDGWLQPGVVYAPPAKVFLVPSRDGLLRVLKDTDKGLATEDAYDRKIRLGENGDALSEPVVVGDTLFVGTTEHGVLAVPFGEGTLPDDARKLYPAPFQVVGPPLVLGSDELANGRVVVTTIAGDVLAYTLEGGKPLWSAQVFGPLSGAPLHLKGIQLNGSSAGAVVLASGDARVQAFALLDGKLFWEHISPVPLAGSPVRFKDEILIPVQGGKIQALDAKTGAATRTLFSEPKKLPMTLLAPEGSDVLYVSTSDGRVRALRAGEKLQWEFRRPAAHIPKVAVMDAERLVVTADSPEVFVILRETGMIVWQGKFPEGGNSRTISPISIVEGGFFVGTNKRFLHLFKVP